MIDLFNLLPYDGEVYYSGPFIPDRDRYLKILLEEIPWRPDEVFVNGALRFTKRKVAWFGDQPYEYRYSGVTRRALPWTPSLLGLKQLVEDRLGDRFNSCLLNLYNDGSEGMSWHSDNEDALVKRARIASVSFGAERKFSLKHKRTKETVSVRLEHGSLLVMMGETQEHWLHSVGTSTVVTRPRVNLTFRKIVAG